MANKVIRKLSLRSNTDILGIPIWRLIPTPAVYDILSHTDISKTIFFLSFFLIPIYRYRYNIGIPTISVHFQYTVRSLFDFKEFSQVARIFLRIITKYGTNVFFNLFYKYSDKILTGLRCMSLD